MSLGTAAIHRVDVVSLRPLLKPGADQAKQKYTGSSCFLSSGLVPGVQQESGLHLSPSSFSFSFSLFSSPLIFFHPVLFSPSLFLPPVSRSLQLFNNVPSFPVLKVCVTHHYTGVLYLFFVIPSRHPHTIHPHTHTPPHTPTQGMM